MCETFCHQRKILWSPLLTVIVFLLGSQQGNAGWYLGCFNENRRDRAFNISAGNYLVSDTSARECTSACAFLNQSYAARDGDLCFCSNGPYDKYGSASSDNLCDAVCSNPCNDTSHVRVYSTQDAIGGLALPGPQIGWLFQEVNFTAFVAKGDINTSYTYDFGDGSYLLTTCRNVTHVYSRLGLFQVKVSARNNMSGPIMASRWMFIQSSTGSVTLDYPSGIVEAENATQITLSVSQGTAMDVKWMASLTSWKKVFNLSDAVVYDVGSSATRGNHSSLPDTDGAYVIPTAMIRKSGHILAWEFEASKVGPIRVQVYRPSCSAVSDQFCLKNQSCVPKADTCFSLDLFTCPSNNICMGSGRCLLNCQKENLSFSSSLNPPANYVIIAESLISISKVGTNLIIIEPAKTIQVQAGDVIGWVRNSSSGSLTFERTTNDPSFFYPRTKFSTTIRASLTASANVRRHEIKHILRAHVSQPSLAAVNINFIGAGIHNVTAVVSNTAESELKTCEISVQERIENLTIIWPLSTKSYETGTKVQLKSSVTKGSNISYTWKANNLTYNEESPELVFIQSGIYQISLHARNNISSKNASSIIRILRRASIAWFRKPPAKVDVDVQWNASVILNGTNVTVSIDIGGKLVNKTIYESDRENYEITFPFVFTKGGVKDIIVKARNNISLSPSQLTSQVTVKGKIGDITIELRPEPTAEKHILKISTNQNFGITVSTSIKQPVNYTFKFSEDFTSKPIHTADGYTKITHKYTKETNFTVVITANITGHSEERFVHVIAKPCGPPALFFPDAYIKSAPLVITKQIGLSLKTHIEKESCTQGEPQYQWNMFDKDDNLVPLPETVSRTGQSLEMALGNLEIGNYSVSLNVTYSLSQEVIKYFFQTYIRLEHSDLVAEISGGSFRQVNFNHSASLTLDASRSQDPDDSQTPITFSWECKFDNNSVDAVHNELCNSTSFIKLPGDRNTAYHSLERFRKRVNYTFRVTVSKEKRSKSASQVVELIQGIPSLEISCQNCRDKINPQERLTLTGNCTNCEAPKDQLTSQTWKLLDENGNEDIHLSGNISVTDSDLGWNAIHLVLKDRVLKEDTTYIAQLTGVRDNKMATVQFRLRTTSAPTGGTCSVAPKSGVALETFFDIRCSDWVTSDNPITYNFFYNVKLKDLAKINSLSAESQPSQKWYSGDRYTPASYFPLGDENNDFILGLRVHICNKYDCCADFPLEATVTPKELKADEYNQLQKNISEELDQVGQKSNPDEVARVVISAASSLNYGDTTDPQTLATKTKIRSTLVDKLASVTKDKKQDQIVISALIEVTRNKKELPPQTQNTAADLVNFASSQLNSDAKDPNFGPVKVEEYSRNIFTASSNVLEASKETSFPFLEEALQASIPTTAPPSRDWAIRNQFLESEQDALESKTVLESIIFQAIELVSEAIQRKKLPGERETNVETIAFSMKLKRSTVATINSTVTQDSSVRVKIPNSTVILKGYDRSDPIDIQFISMNNPFVSDYKWSPYINSNIQGFSLIKNNREIRLQNLEEDLEVRIPTNLPQASESFSVNFTVGTIKMHRFEMIPDMPNKNMMLRVKPENGETLKVNFSLEFEASASVYKLIFPVPHNQEEIPAPFRGVDSYAYMARELPSKPRFSNLNVTVTEPVTSQGRSGNNASRTVHVNYTVTMYSVQCMYVDRRTQEWRNEGCQVGDDTTSEFTQCLCNHATFFGSLNVKPNPISLPTLTALKKGYAMLIFVCVIFMFYFIGLVWARRKDRANIVEVGVCPLRDNDPSDPYRYELTLWTGMRRNAGTKSKVSIIVYGDENDSEPRALENPGRDPFQRGSQDSFLLTTSFDMGNIQYIRVWHDNTGGSWFFSRIMVIDLQSDERYFFICNRWLAVDEEDGQVERIIPLASKEELTEFGHLFVARTRRNLSDNHLWFSVLARPPNSRFTRVQRLSCCLCLLLMSMMASGMYYDRENNPADLQRVGEFVFTWQQVLIGIISSLIVFPINLIVVQIFRNVRPKPKVRPKKAPAPPPSLSLTEENLENYNQLKELSDESTKGSSNSLDSSREKNNKTRLSINDVHTDIDRASFTDSPLLLDRRLSTTYEITPTSRFQRALLFFKKKNSLPYYFVYVAWALVFIFSIGSAVVVVLYGMQFENVKSLQWLFSSCVSFVQDVLITQPLKVLGLAVFFALVIKKPDKGEFEITEEALKLAEDEEFLQQSSSNQSEQRKKTTLLPPDQARLIAMRTARMKERKMYSVIREVTTYYVFLALLLTIAYTHRSPAAFFQTRNLVDTMGKNFTKITNTKEFWNWTRHELLESLFPTKLYNGDPTKPDGFMADGVSQMVGGARMRLIRIERESCKVPTEVYGITRECFGEYFITKDDKEDYTEGWRNVTTYYTKITWDDMMWRYQNGSQLDGYPFWATFNTYSGGGYTIVLEPGMDNRNRIKNLEKNLWIERHTRAILTEFTVYNAQSNLFSVVTLVAELPAIGAVIPHASIQTIRLYDFTDSYMFFVITINVLFVLFILFFAYREAKNIYKNGIQAYVKEFWNCVEAGIVVLTFAAIALYVYRALAVRNVLDIVRHAPFRFKSFQFASSWDETYTFILAFIVLLANIKLNKLLRFNKRFSLLSSTLKYAYYPLVMFSVIWGIVFIAFTLVASLVFGPALWNYRNIPASLTSLLSLMLGRTAFFEMRDTNRILGPMFFFIFMFMMSFVLINMFLSIVVDSFCVVKHDNDKQSNEYEIVDFIIERFKLWSGIGKSRRPHSRNRVLWDTAACRVKAINAFKQRPHSVTIAGLRIDTVSELENRLEKLVDRTDVLYEELFPEKRRHKMTRKQGPLSKGDLLEGQSKST